MQIENELHDSGGPWVVDVRRIHCVLENIEMVVITLVRFGREIDPHTPRPAVAAGPRFGPVHRYSGLRPTQVGQWIASQFDDQGIDVIEARHALSDACNARGAADGVVRWSQKLPHLFDRIQQGPGKYEVAMPMPRSVMVLSPPHFSSPK